MGAKGYWFLSTHGSNYLDGFSTVVSGLASQARPLTLVRPTLAECITMNPLFQDHGTSSMLADAGDRAQPLLSPL